MLQDTGLGVRKRVIKLLKGMYFILDQQNYRVDTCCRLVGMVADQDEGVKVSVTSRSMVDIHVLLLHRIPRSLLLQIYGSATSQAPPTVIHPEDLLVTQIRV